MNLSFNRNHDRIIYMDVRSAELTKYAALQDADALVICTEWQQFRAPDFDEMEARMAAKSLLMGATCTSRTSCRLRVGTTSQ